MYVILHTDNPDLPAGYGLTFTLGRGNEIVAAMCASPTHTPSVRTWPGSGEQD